jgi:hypothetical protein
MSVRLSKCAASEVAWRFRGAGPGGGDLKRMLTGLTDESVCPTLVRRGLRSCGQALPPANR